MECAILLVKLFFSAYDNDSKDSEEIRRRRIRNFAAGRYKGDTIKGIPSGHGTFKFDNGDVYVGQFIEGLMHGNGRLIYANGIEFEGTFHKGHLHC